MQPNREKDDALPKAAAAIPTRDQVKIQDTWDLSPVYQSPQEWRAAYEKLQADFPRVTRWKGRVGESATTLREVLEFERELDIAGENVRVYAFLKCAEDAANSESLARQSQVAGMLTLMGEARAFIAPEIQAIDDDTFATYLAAPELSEWVIPLTHLRRLKKHTLSPAEERIMALAGSALRGFDDASGQLMDVDMKFGTIKDSDGKETELSQGSWMSLLLRPDNDLRRRAFKQFYAEFDDHKFTLASTLSHSVKADVFRARARNFPSAREGALFYDDVPVAVYDNLIATVRANFTPLFKYLELRKKALKLDELHQYDLYIPLVPDFQKRTTFDEGTDLVLTSLAPLGDEYVSVLGEGLRKQRWCDRYENKGKNSGAFSSGTFQNPPYLLMNYKEDVFGDVYTLAHEVGHSMHSWYCSRNQPFQTYDYPIFLAEVASTFNECLLTDHLLKTTDDPKFRAYILCREIDDLRSTIYRQTMFAEFEKITHAKEEAGEPLTLDVFRQVYRGLLADYFGPGFVIDSELELECLRIPHFYYSFYVYKYATGLSAAVALASQVLAAGDASRYLSFLKSGGSEFPIPTLQKAGVDMSTPAPIDSALKHFAKRVNELESLLG
ncbi:MAG TPA: oligoendopeptidase F [Chthoniobacteraceae bacterium]|nr:oligoendopeptidase F [Chthoniobacteraceae bacterium]